MKEKRYGPEEIIYDNNEIVHTLYFVMKGDIDIALPFSHSNYN